MGVQCDWPCWEIMDCAESKMCPAKSLPDKPCWEIAKEKGDYKYISQICSDCIVYMLKGDSNTLSQDEIQAIMVSKANCILTSDECVVNY